MSAATFDDAAASAPVSTSLQTVQFEPDERDPPRPLPYPPREVWCVWLEPLDGDADQVVLVARHQDDLCNAEWVVHEPRADGKDALPVWATAGCDLPG